MKVFYSEICLKHTPKYEITYGHSIVHPESPSRLTIIKSHLIKLKEQNNNNSHDFEILSPQDYGLDPILSVHDKDYVDFLQNSYYEWCEEGGNKDGVVPDTFAHFGMKTSFNKKKITSTLAKAGLYCFDTTYTWKATYESAQVCISGAIELKKLAYESDQSSIGIFCLCRPPGHHANQNLCGGYCFLNNVAIVTNILIDKEKNLKKVVILDIDYHHGNGTQDIFYSDSNPLYVSFHAENDYPWYTGDESEIGIGEGESYNINVPLSKNTDDQQYLEQLKNIINNKIIPYNANYLAVSLGVDTYKDDPIGGLNLTSECYLEIGKLIKSINLPTLFVLEGLITYIALYYIKYFTRTSPLPGPTPLPLIGNLHSDNLNEWLNNLQSKYGDIFEVWKGSERHIWISRADLATKLLNPSYKNNSFPWRFGENEGLDLMDMTRKGTVYNRDLNSLIFNHWMMRFMTDFTFIMITNHNVYALTNYYATFQNIKDGLPDKKILKESEKLVESIRAHFMASAYFKDTSKYSRYLLPGNRLKSKRLLDQVNWLNTKVIEMINQRKQLIKESNNELLSSDMLTMLLTLKGDSEKEIENIVGKDVDSMINYYDLHKLHYCEAIIKEVSRLMPTVSVLFRYSSKPEQIANYQFPKSTQFLINVQGVHMNPLHWKDPKVFNPDRFLENQQSSIHNNSLLYFGGGSKICPGRQIAMLQLKCLMVLFYRKYDIKLKDPNHPIKYFSTVVNHCLELPIKLQIKRQYR
ncbi:4273_t:CDS:10 [Entrophospora sp. SA101]|nr:4273_t:CDS:10 [Entrophospora sp. SA101]